jgi:hypothetical protein
VQATLVNEAFASGAKQFGGKLLKTLGDMTEKAVKNLVEQCLKPGASLSRAGKRPVPGGGNALPDFFVTMGKTTKYIEVKFSLGEKTSESFARAARQLKAATKESDTLLVTFRDLAMS